MTSKFSFFLILLNVVISCNSGVEEPAKDEQLPAGKPSAETNLSNCYRFIKNRDTIILKTVDKNGAITGTLVYNFYEKDKNTGTIRGRMNGEMLIADYSFMSEGVLSSRQVAFKKNGKNLIEGYGEAEDTNGKTIFKNVDSLKFSNSPELTPFECEN